MRRDARWLVAELGGDAPRAFERDAGESCDRRGRHARRGTRNREPCDHAIARIAYGYRHTGDAFVSLFEGNRESVPADLGELCANLRSVRDRVRRDRAKLVAEDALDLVVGPVRQQYLRRASRIEWRRRADFENQSQP